MRSEPRTETQYQPDAGGRCAAQERAVDGSEERIYDGVMNQSRHAMKLRVAASV